MDDFEFEYVAHVIIKSKFKLGRLEQLGREIASVVQDQVDYEYDVQNEGEIDVDCSMVEEL